MRAARRVPADLVGTQQDRLFVTGYERRDDGQAVLLCVCVCGTQRDVLLRNYGLVRSCGCLQREVAATTRRTHGDSKEPLYAAWKGMLQRCRNPKRREYVNYGGRGITVCEEWDDYAAFRNWALANGYEHGLDLDRIDNDGPYTPGNCRFVTRSRNLRNTRRSRMVSAFGETKSLSDWSDDPRCSIAHTALDARLRYGWVPEDAITLPKGRWNPCRRSPGQATT